MKNLSKALLLLAMICILLYFIIFYTKDNRSYYDFIENSKKDFTPEQELVKKYQLVKIQEIEPNCFLVDALGNQIKLYNWYIYSRQTQEFLPINYSVFKPIDLVMAELGGGKLCLDGEIKRSNIKFNITRKFYNYDKDIGVGCIILIFGEKREISCDNENTFYIKSY